jgi:hypothetical protein
MIRSPGHHHYRANKGSYHANPLPRQKTLTQQQGAEQQGHYRNQALENGHVGGGSELQGGVDQRIEEGHPGQRQPQQGPPVANKHRPVAPRLAPAQRQYHQQRQKHPAQRDGKRRQVDQRLADQNVAAKNRHHQKQQQVGSQGTHDQVSVRSEHDGAVCQSRSSLGVMPK